MILIGSLLHSPAHALSSSTFFVTQTPSHDAPLISLHGVIKPAIAGATVRIFSKEEERWVDLGLTGRTSSLGTWKIRTQIDSTEKRTFRAEIAYQSKSLTTAEKSLTIRPVSSIPDPSALIAKSGPGTRIYGSDVSRWQHPNDQPINFAKMYKAGMRFVMIKASDSRDDSDALARKYLAMDRHAAQAAGLFTGFYHYAALPNTSSREVLISDAKAQAQRAIWRLASVGGYSELDLPYALDLENNC